MPLQPSSTYQPIPPTFHYRKPVRGSLVWWLRFLGIVAFLIVLSRLPSAQHAVQLFRLDLRWLGLCMLLTMVQLALEAFAWHWLLIKQRIRHPYPKTLVAYLAGQYLGLVTPGHVGEFLAAGYISSETGITIGYALSSVVMKKILSWTTIIGFGIWSLPLVAQVPIHQGIWELLTLSVLALVILSVGITVWVVSLRRLTRKWQQLSPWQIDMTEFWSGMRHLRSPQLIVPLAVVVLAFSLLFVQLESVLRSLGMALPLLLVAKIVALSRILARLIPISVVGFGSKDAAVIWLLAQQNIDPAVGFSVTILWLVCSYLVTLLLSGLCWWIKPLVVRRVSR